MSGQPHGIYPVLYAFFNAEGRIDWDAMARQVEFCIAAGAHGITVLGLVTEVQKFDVNERREIVENIGALIGGRAGYAVTVCEPSIPGQIEFARMAQKAGADWLILQPPSIRGMTQAGLIDWFGTIAAAIDLPVAVQNNPVNLDVSLGVDGLVELNRQHPNISILKGEGWSVDIASAIEESQGAYRVFGGHGGIEFPALLHSGGHGLIPAPDFLHPQLRIYELWQRGDAASRAEASEIHRRILPSIVFMSRSLPGLLCYGKRLFSSIAGIDPGHDRAPAIVPTAFGLSEIERFREDIQGAGG